MKKFIAAFDGLKLSESTLQYAIKLASQFNAHLIGVSLEDVTRHSYGLAEVVSYEGEAYDQHVHQLDTGDREKREESIHYFEQMCSDAGITYSVHKDRNIAIHDLLHESIYADLLIIEASETLTRYEEHAPTRFIRDLLVDVQCPVLLVPPKYKPIEKVILLYDGSPVSVFALKAFGYMFDGSDFSETEIVTVKHQDDSLHLPDNRLMKEYVKRHFPKAEYVVVKGIPEEEAIKYIRMQKKDALVVLGAYRRNRISRLFKPSMADYLLHHLKLPLFIAHN